jgi:hypothetical protein
VKPQQTSEFLLHFGAPWSPGWLAVVVPVVVLAGAWLARRQFPNLPRWQVVGLLGLRLGLLAALAFLLFRPTVVYRKILTYAGRVVVLLDNTASMTAKDTGYTDAEAARMARRLGLEPATPLHQQAVTVERIAAIMQTFGDYSRRADRRQDSFWVEAGRVKSQLAELFAQLDPPASELQAQAETFLTGSADPGRRAYDEFAGRAAALARQLLDRQAALDSGHPIAPAVRAKTRWELLEEKLRQTPVAVSNQFVQVEMLHPIVGHASPSFGVRAAKNASAHARREASTTGIPALQSNQRGTDLVGRLTELLRAESEFPLSGIVLFSDGRDTSGRAVRELVQEAARREVPICAAGVGSPREPVDLAVVRVGAPPFAVQDQPVRVKLLLKTALPAPTAVKLAVLDGATPVAEQELTLGAQPTQPVTIEFTPRALGLRRYTARLAGAAGEIFPTQNNTADFALEVRDRKAWVLFLDWRPRWETRFALNILQRLEYVELNSIIGIVQENAEVPRGTRKGAWPATLEAYDLILVGDLPPGTLTATEEAALRAVVERAGRTVCYLGRRAGNGPLHLTEAGRVHPLTRRLVAPTTMIADETVLLADAGGPVVATEFRGAGKVAQIFTDDLWKLLNPTQLDAHTELYAGLVSWALQAEAGGPDLRAYKASEPIQVWHTNAIPARVVYTNMPAELAERVVVVEDDPELHFLARDDRFLEAVAAATGGTVTEFAEYETGLRAIQPKQRVETRERRWRLWDSGVVLAVLAGWLTVEWVWRKWVGLV